MRPLHGTVIRDQPELNQRHALLRTLAEAVQKQTPLAYQINIDRFTSRPFSSHYLDSSKAYMDLVQYAAVQETDDEPCQWRRVEEYLQSIFPDEEPPLSLWRIRLPHPGIIQLINVFLECEMPRASHRGGSPFEVVSAWLELICQYFSAIL